MAVMAGGERMSSRNNNHRNNRRVKISGTIGDMPVALEIEGVNAQVADAIRSARGAR